MYIIIHTYVIGGIPSHAIYLATHSLLVFKLSSWFRFHVINFNWLSKGVVGIACFVSLFCFIQYIGWLNSKNAYFSVTGTWENPNITALFLAMTTPFFFYNFQKEAKKRYLIGFLLVLLSLYLLGSTTN